MVKRIWIFIFTLLLVMIGLSACRPEIPEVEPTLAMKGVELYSWQTDAGEWRYSLLPGTNREKTLDEVQDAPLDQAALEAALDALPEGEMVFWVNWVNEARRAELAFPPENIVAEIMAFAIEVGVDLEVLNP